MAWKVLLKLPVPIQPQNVYTGHCLILVYIEQIQFYSHVHQGSLFYSQIHFIISVIVYGLRTVNFLPNSS